MDGDGQRFVFRTIVLLAALCSPLASMAQVQERRAVRPTEAGAWPTTPQAARGALAPAARFTFADSPNPRPIDKAASPRTRVDPEMSDKAIAGEQNHGYRHVSQVSGIEDSPTENTVPSTVDSSPTASGVRSTVQEETAASGKKWQQGGLEYNAPMPPEPPDLRALVTRFVFGTAAVLVACVACLWMARRWLSHNVPTGKADGHMKLVATVNLSHRSSLQLVDIEGQKVLVGSDASGIKTVTPLTESFLDNLEQAAEEQVGDDRQRFPFGSLTRQVT